MNDGKIYAYVALGGNGSFPATGFPPMTKNIPPNGSLVRFIQAPRCSYVRVGDVMRVTYQKRRPLRGSDDIHVVAEDGAGTFDRAWSYADAQWELVA
jgi:hypothetical protein